MTLSKKCNQSKNICLIFVFWIWDLESDYGEQFVGVELKYWKLIFKEKYQTFSGCSFLNLRICSFSLFHYHWQTDNRKQWLSGSMEVNLKNLWYTLKKGWQKCKVHTDCLTGKNLQQQRYSLINKLLEFTLKTDSRFLNLTLLC